jgi:ATP-dependent RNA helicase RhlE
MKDSNLTTFSELGLAEPILKAIAAEGYENPTPIQGQAIPELLSGRDLMGIAQTGTGKTAAFVLPLLNALAATDERAGPRHCGALIMVPTRELATQISDNLRLYGKGIRFTSAVIVGGVKPGGQLKAMARGVDIMIATPGRLLDHLTAGAVRLDKTSHVVLDEADQMLDMGFIPAIRKIMAKLPKRRQTAMLSATMPRPIRDLAADFLNNPVEVSVAPASKPIERIEQQVMFVQAGAKRDILALLLRPRDVQRAIVFTRTKHGADRVAKHLDRLGMLVEAIHGNKSQNNRQKTLDQFRNGKINILVATDVAARGIDIDDVTHVINFELPNVPEAYVHRIGRTARAGRDGIAIALCDNGERKHLRDIERLTGVRLTVTEPPLLNEEVRAELQAAAEAAASRPGAAAQEVEEQERGERRERGNREGRREGRTEGRREGGHRDGARRDGARSGGFRDGNRDGSRREFGSRDGAAGARGGARDGARGERSEGFRGRNDNRSEGRSENRRGEGWGDNRGERRHEPRRAYDPLAGGNDREAEMAQGERRAESRDRREHGGPRSEGFRHDGNRSEGRGSKRPQDRNQQRDNRRRFANNGEQSGAGADQKAHEGGKRPGKPAFGKPAHGKPAHPGKPGRGNFQGDRARGGGKPHGSKPRHAGQGNGGQGRSRDGGNGDRRFAG